MKVKKLQTVLTIIISAILASGTALAAPEVSMESGVKVEIPIGDTTDDDSLLHTYTKIDLEGELTETVWGKLGLDFYLQDTTARPWASLWDTKTTAATDQAIETVVDEAYLFVMEPYGLPLDLKVGRQHVNMGRGDGVTTLNLFAPASLRYATELSENMPIGGVRTDWYLGDYTITGLVQTKLTPAAYSERVQNFYLDIAAEELKPLLEAFGGGLPVNPIPSVVTPKLGKDDTDLGVGVAVGTNYFGYDLDLVYQHGYVAIPTLQAVAAEPADGYVNLLLTQGYLPMDKVGLTMAGAVRDAGVWAEFTYNRPDQDFFALDLLPKETRPSDAAYLTWLLGADYFFANGAYANLQYVKGLPQEYTEDMLNDYLVVDAYQTFKSDMLKVEGQLMVCLGDGSMAVIPGVSYKLNDDLTLTAKAIKFLGDSNETLGRMEPLSTVALGLNWAF